MKNEEPKQRPNEVPGEDTRSTDCGMTGGGNQGEFEGHPVLDVPETPSKPKSELETEIDEQAEEQSTLDPKKFAELEPVETKHEAPQSDKPKAA